MLLVLTDGALSLIDTVAMGELLRDGNLPWIRTAQVLAGMSFLIGFLLRFLN